MKHALALGFVLLAVVVPGSAPSAAPPKCVEPKAPLRYPDVQPILDSRCGNCHDARKSDNAAAQAIFEMSRFPFTTNRPATLRADLRRMILGRSLDSDDKCRVLSWLTAGALDAAGKPAPWK